MWNTQTSNRSAWKDNWNFRQSTIFKHRTIDFAKNVLHTLTLNCASDGMVIYASFLFQKKTISRKQD